MQDQIENAWWQLVKFGFRLLYNEMAFTYDGVAWLASLGQWRNWQRTALDHLNAKPGETVLELAHGTGNTQLDLHAHGYKRLGLDLSAHMGRLATRKLNRHHLPAPLVRGDAQTLPFASASVDAVVSTFPTPFITEQTTLDEIARVLKPNRRLVIVANGVLVSGGIMRDALETAYQVTGQRTAWPNELAQRFATAGFTLESVQQRCPMSIAQLFIATKTAPNHRSTVE